MSALHPQSFVYLRHGETDWNREGRLQGNIDTPLNRAGERQAERSRAILVGRGLTAIYHSPLARARRTAEIVNQALELPLVEVEDLREASFGVLEGSLRDWGGNSDWYEDWKSGRATPEGGEAFADFMARALAAVNHCLEDAKIAGHHPLIVAHGGVYWAVRQAAALANEGPLPNALPRLHLPAVGRLGLEWRIEDLGLDLSGGVDERDLALR